MRLRLILIFALIGLVSAVASALTTDSVILTVTPSFNLSVNISSQTYDFGLAGQVDLGTTRTLCIGLIENDGNVASKWQKITPSQTGTSGDKWSLLTGDGNNPNDITGINTFKLLVISTGETTSPDLTSTDTTNRCLMGDHDQICATAGTYTDLTEGGADSPKHPKSEKRKLWASLMMPTNITTSGQQTITLSVLAIVQ